MQKIINYTEQLLVIVIQVVSLPFAVSVGACVTLYVASSSVLMCAISTEPLRASLDVTSSFLPYKHPLHACTFIPFYILPSGWLDCSFACSSLWPQGVSARAV